MIAALAVWTATLAGPCLLPPVDAPVVRGFEPPACTWCPGHRGLRLGSPPGADVVAPVAGVVSFAGAVAGRRWVTVLGGDGTKVTVGPLLGVDAEVGERLVAGEPIGRSTGPLLLTVRRHDVYVDPEPLLARRVGRPRLVPGPGGSGRSPRGVGSLACG